MARGDFAKAFSEHRKNGGTMTRSEYGVEYRRQRLTKISEEVKVEQNGEQQ